MYYALGTVKRPTYYHAEPGQVSMRNDTEEFIFEFEDLNYDYANKIAIEDIPSFGQEEFGKFFYEYGRLLFANLIIAMTHLDWDALGEKAHNELRFVADYYDELLKLHNRAKEVLDAFCDTIKLTRDEKAPYYDFLSAASEIIHIKQGNSFSFDNPDIKNTKILSLAYTAAWFSIVGYLLIFCHKTDVDGLSRLPDAANNAREAKVLIKSIAESQEEDSKIINICSLIFSFFHINRLYLISSGLTTQDPLLELLGKFSSHLMDLINDENDLIIIDSDLIMANTDTGSSIAAFTDKYDPLADIARFSGTGIIKIDTANIWDFGKEYLYTNLYQSIIS
jgi:hypothetical protein